MRRRTKRNLLLASYAILLAIIIYLAVLDVKLHRDNATWAGAYRQLQELSGIGNFGSTHEHADFLVFVNGKQLDLTKPEFILRHGLTHIDPGEDNEHLIHKHATGVTYGMFFTTVGIELGDCLAVNGKEFCDANSRTVKYYLNGRITPDLASVEITDLDKVLISYGSENAQEVQEQLAAIGNNACVQSRKC